MIDLKKNYGKQVKVTLEESWEGGDKTPYWIIKGKRGDIMAYDDDRLDVYITSAIIANQFEEKHPAKAHYDDATAFLVKSDAISEAFRAIKPRNRRQLSPEQRELLVKRFATMRSNLKKASEISVPAEVSPKNGE